jgi:monovalent cation:proton antiporter-2 (CPA2) family protein
MDFLAQAFVYLLVAVLTVPLTKRLGFGSVLGYLVAGVLIGPSGLKLVGDRVDDVAQVAQFGVVMMLFIVGLELQPSSLWKLRVQLLGLGGLQVFGTATVIAAVGLAAGYGLKTPFALGLILAMSSTAIVLQSLQERSLMRTDGGKASFAVLLFQDISVIPILAILPLLAIGEVATDAAQKGGHQGWFKMLAIVGVFAAIIFAGKHLMNPLFRAIAKTQLRELFTATALLLVVGLALAMEKLGLSPALGTFLGGVLLADNEYRHELESDIEPFKGLLLGLFFIAVGAGIDFALMRSEPFTIAGLVAALIAIKFVILFLLSRLFKIQTPDGILFATALAQVGEFAFVLLQFSVDSRVLTAAQSSTFVAVVALSMAVTPLLFMVHAKWVQPLFAKRIGTPREPDKIEAEDHEVIIAGMGRFGTIVARILRSNGIGATVLDHDADQIEVMGKLGVKVFYGDASRLDLLHAAGAAKAKIFVIAIDDAKKRLELVETLQRHFPHLKIFARAEGRADAYELQKRNIVHDYRETVGSSIEMGVGILRAMGMRAHHAYRVGRRFRFYEDKNVRELAQFWDDDVAYFNESRNRIAEMEKMFAADKIEPGGAEAWEPPAKDDKTRG